jgi:RNA polymerase sigma factor (sigma-70 family)
MRLSNWPLRRRQPEAGDPAATAEALELALLDGVKRGRLADFEKLYRLYHPRLSRFLSHMLRQRELVEEVLDDTLLVLWQDASAFGGRSKLSTWVFGIAYRKALKAIDRQDLPVDAAEGQELADPAAGPDQQLNLAQLRRRLLAALAELSPEHRAVVELCYFSDMAYGEIAEVVGCPPETVKTRMFYARRRLRTLLDDLSGLGV